MDVEVSRGIAVKNEDEVILYAAVSGDILGTFRQWLTGTRDVGQIALTYSGQFYDLCRELHRPGVAIGIGADAEEFTSENITIVAHREPVERSGLRYHISMIRRALSVVAEARKRDAKDLIVMDGAGYWFPLWLLSPRRRIFLSVHTVLKAQGAKTSLLRRVILAAESWFVRRRCAGVLAVSDEIGRQMASLAKGVKLRTEIFRPTYIAHDFAEIAPANDQLRPFIVLYAGRIEESKGVFDLIEMAKLLRWRGHDCFIMRILGDGSDLSRLREQIQKEGLASKLECLGHRSRREMIDELAAAHCVIVPTRSTFPEGFNKVVVEAVLARRPVVTSRICPALEVVRQAAIEAEPDDPKSYADAIITLMTDGQCYQSKVQAGQALAFEFTDPSRSWRAAAARLINTQTAQPAL